MKPLLQAGRYGAFVTDCHLQTQAEKAHEALADIRGTLGKLRFYRKMMAKT